MTVVNEIKSTGERINLIYYHNGTFGSIDLFEFLLTTEQPNNKVTYEVELKDSISKVFEEVINDANIVSKELSREEKLIGLLENNIILDLKIKNKSDDIKKYHLMCINKIKEHHFDWLFHYSYKLNGSKRIELRNPITKEALGE